MKNNNTFKLVIMALGVVFNIAGGFIAVGLKLPIYLDTIGTFMSAFFFGPIAGILTGAVTSIINGVSFDPVYLYFMPVQIIIGLTAGVLYKKGLFKGKFAIVGTFVVTLIGSVMASLIAAYVFGGITSSGSSFIVMYLKEAGVNVVAGVFSTQIISDILDKAIAVALVLKIMDVIPKGLKERSYGEI